MSGVLPGQQQGQTPTGFAAGYNTVHPEQVIDSYLRDHGVNPLNHSGLGDFMKTIMAKIVPTLFQQSFGANGQMSDAQIADPRAMLDSIFNHGSSMGGNLRDFAQHSMGQLQGSPTMQNMSLAEMQNFLTNNNALLNYGNNPYESKANMQGLQDQFTTFERGNYNGAHQLPGANGPNDTLYAYMMAHAAQLMGLTNGQGQAAAAGALGTPGNPFPTNTPPAGPQTNGGLGNGQPY